MASIGSINAQGASGVQYRFALYDLRTTFKPLGAVYCFLCGEQPVYVGETGDLSTRFNNHHRAADIRLNRADRIGILLEPNNQRRLQIERDLLMNYLWPCNA